MEEMYELLAHAASNSVCECYNSLGLSRMEWEIKIVLAVCLPLVFSVLVKGKWIPNELTQTVHSYVQIMFAEWINDAVDKGAFSHSLFFYHISLSLFFAPSKFIFILHAMHS